MQMIRETKHIRPSIQKRLRNLYRTRSTQWYCHHEFREYVTNDQKVTVGHTIELDRPTHVQRHSLVTESNTEYRHRPAWIHIHVFLLLTVNTCANEQSELLTHLEPEEPPPQEVPCSSESLMTSNCCRMYPLKN